MNLTSVTSANSKKLSATIMGSFRLQYNGMKQRRNTIVYLSASWAPACPSLQPQQDEAVMVQRDQYHMAPAQHGSVL